MTAHWHVSRYCSGSAAWCMMLELKGSCSFQAGRCACCGHAAAGEYECPLPLHENRATGVTFWTSPTKKTPACSFPQSAPVSPWHRGVSSLLSNHNHSLICCPCGSALHTSSLTFAAQYVELKVQLCAVQPLA